MEILIIFNTLLSILIKIIIIYGIKCIYNIIMETKNEINNVLIEAGIIDKESVKKPSRGRPKKQKEELIVDEKIEQYRSKLGCIIASGQSNAFLGKTFTLHDINNMSETDINKYYKLYESTYSTLVSDNIVDGFLNGSSKLFSFVLPIDDADRLSDDLKANFLVTTELKKLTGSLAYSFGPALALLSGGLTISKHIDLKHKCPKKELTTNDKLEIKQLE